MQNRKSFFHRRFVLIPAVLMLLSAPLTGAGMKLFFHAENKKNAPEVFSEQKEMEKQLEMSKAALAALEVYLQAEDVNEKIYEDIFHAKQEILYYETALTYQVPVWSYPYLFETVSRFVLNTLTPEGPASENETLLRIMTERDFEGFTAFENERIAKDPSLSESEKEAQIEENKLRFRLDPSGAALSARAEILISQIRDARRSLLENTDRYNPATKGDSLSPSAKKTMEKKLSVLTYQLERGHYCDDKSVSGAVSLMEWIPFLFFFVLCLAWAAGERGNRVSIDSTTSENEKAAGRPGVRPLHNVFFAITCILLLLTLVIACSVYLLFPEGAVVFVFPVGGRVFACPFPLAVFFSLLCRFAEICPVLAFALLLSRKVKKAWVRFTVPLALFIIGKITNAVLQITFPRSLWLDLLPFSQCNLRDQLFRFSDRALVTLPPPLFSLVYIAALSFGLLLMARRRNKKIVGVDALIDPL